MHKRITLDPGGVDLGNGGRTTLGNDPDNWLKLRLSWAPSARHEVDVFLRHYGALEFGNVPSYTAVDARLGWRVTPAFELALVLQNLTDGKHVEWQNRVALERAAFFRVTWRP
jgi:iron complex outermembrane receptor protein